MKGGQILGPGCRDRPRHRAHSRCTGGHAAALAHLKNRQDPVTQKLENVASLRPHSIYDGLEIASQRGQKVRR
jgi:hypothetical protein